MKNLSKEDWKDLISSDPNAILLDVRTPKECAEGIQPNAVQLDFLDNGKFTNGITELDKDKNYYVYCRSGNRSGQACNAMKAKGFITFNLIGGMLQWDGEIVK